MAYLILFYIIVLSYFAYLFIYIRKTIKENDQDTIVDTIARINRNLLFISVITVFFSSQLLFKTNNENSIKQSNIGIALASGTFIFFTVFLLWDILKNKIKTSYDNEDANVESSRFLSMSASIVIGSISIIILEVVISIMILVGGV